MRDISTIYNQMYTESWLLPRISKEAKYGQEANPAKIKFIQAMRRFEVSNKKELILYGCDGELPEGLTINGPLYIGSDSHILKLPAGLVAKGAIGVHDGRLEEVARDVTILPGKNTLGEKVQGCLYACSTPWAAKMLQQSGDSEFVDLINNYVNRGIPTKKHDKTYMKLLVFEYRLAAQYPNIPCISLSRMSQSFWSTPLSEVVKYDTYKKLMQIVHSNVR